MLILGPLPVAGRLQFHFRGTPHPQNVRRRIKQLKDYISVTSDWISYALIDDISDAFGPLVQSIEYEVDSIGPSLPPHLPPFRLSPESDSDRPFSHFAPLQTSSF